MLEANQVRGAVARGWQAVRRASPAAILLAGFAVFVLYAFPGYMSNDSVDQLLDARGRAFSDAHPPIMAAEWSVLDLIVSGPILMLLVQGALFLWGLAALLRRVAGPRGAALLAVAVLLFPPVLTTMAVIWKDSQMAAYLLAGAAVVQSPRRGGRLVGLGLLTLACAFRYNAFAASVPLVGLLFEWRPGLAWWKRYAISGAAAALSVVAAFGLNRALTVHHVDAIDGVALADIAGVLNFGRDRTDTELREILRGLPLRSDTEIQARTRRLFSPRSAMAVFYGEESLFTQVGPQHHEAVARAWRELVPGDRSAYLAYRLAGFRELLGLSDSDLWFPVWFQFLGYPELRTRVNHNAAWSGFQVVTVAWAGWMAFDTPLFRPYLYALLALGLLVVCCRDRLSLALLTSGLLYELSYLPAANTVDFRYSHWLVVCTCAAAVMLFVRRLGSRPAEPEETAA
jgi:hypothetical protein